MTQIVRKQTGSSVVTANVTVDPASLPNGTTTQTVIVKALRQNPNNPFLTTDIDAITSFDVTVTKYSGGTGPEYQGVEFDIEYDTAKAGEASYDGSGQSGGDLSQAAVRSLFTNGYDNYYGNYIDTYNSDVLSGNFTDIFIDDPEYPINDQMLFTIGLFSNTGRTYGNEPDNPLRPSMVGNIYTYTKWGIGQCRLKVTDFGPADQTAYESVKVLLSAQRIMTFTYLDFGAQLHKQLETVFEPTVEYVYLKDILSYADWYNEIHTLGNPFAYTSRIGSYWGTLPGFVNVPDVNLGYWTEYTYENVHDFNRDNMMMNEIYYPPNENGSYSYVGYYGSFLKVAPKTDGTAGSNFGALYSSGSGGGGTYPEATPIHITIEPSPRIS